MPTNKNADPFDHYSEKVLWLFALSVIISFASICFSIVAIKTKPATCSAPQPTITTRDYREPSETTNNAGNAIIY
jgi:hypothetical protein